MRIFSVLRVVSVVSVGVLSAGVAGAVPVGDFVPYPGAPFGGQKQLADRYVERVSADGWVLHASKEGEVVHVAAPLDSAVTTGETFGTVSGRVWVDGQGAPELSGAFFDMGYQVGCGVEVGDGVDFEVAGTVGVAPHVMAGREDSRHQSQGIEGGPSVNVAGEAGPSVEVSLPDGSVKLGADGKVKPEAGGDVTSKAERGKDSVKKREVGLDAKAEVSPAVKGHLTPGKVTNVSLVSMPVDKEFMRAAGGFTGAHVQINGCVGPVSVRSYVTLATASRTSVDSVSVYGDAQRIR